MAERGRTSMNGWLYRLPDDARENVLALQERRAMALSLAVGLTVDDKKPMTREEARRVIDGCTREIEKIWREEMRA